MHLSCIELRYFSAGRASKTRIFKHFTPGIFSTFRIYRYELIRVLIILFKGHVSPGYLFSAHFRSHVTYKWWNDRRVFVRPIHHKIMCVDSEPFARYSSNMNCSVGKLTGIHLESQLILH